jgi:hypothetical protein
MQCRVQQVTANPGGNCFARVHLLPNPGPQLVLPILEHFAAEQFAHAQVHKPIVFSGYFLPKFGLVRTGRAFLNWCD